MFRLGAGELCSKLSPLRPPDLRQNVHPGEALRLAGEQKCLSVRLFRLSKQLRTHDQEDQQGVCVVEQKPNRQVLLQRLCRDPVFCLLWACPNSPHTVLDTVDAEGGLLLEKLMEVGRGWAPVQDPTHCQHVAWGKSHGRGGLPTVQKCQLLGCCAPCFLALGFCGRRELSLRGPDG